MPDLTLWLMERGVSEDVLFVLTFVPVLVTLTSFSRYVTGIKTFGIYASMILAIAYYYMGFVQGFTIVLVVVLSSWFIRNFLKNVRLHYLSRLSLVYISTSILVILFIVGMSYLPSDNPYLDFRYIQFLPLAMIISVTDRFMATYIKKDMMTAARLTGETLIISVIGWGIMRWHVTRDLFMYNWWLIPLLIIANVAIGQYSGFRWTEYLRFSQVIKSAEPSEGTTKK